MDSPQSGEGAGVPDQPEVESDSSAPLRPGEDVEDLESEDLDEEGRTPAASPDDVEPEALIEPRAVRGPAANPLRSRNAPLSCGAGDYYTIADNGEVRLVTSANGIPRPSTVPAFSFPRDYSRTYRDEGDHYNGLAIGDGGRVAYAYNRNNNRRLTIRRWTPNDGVRALYTGDIPTLKNVYNYHRKPVYGVDQGSLIAGGIDPTDPNSAFYFGGFFEFKPDRYGHHNVYFHLLKYEGGRVVSVGYVYVREHGADSGNGDIAFSSAGDLFILWNDGKKHTKVVPVLKEELDRARGGEIRPSGKTADLKASKGQANGLAFDSEGNLFVQYSKGGRTRNYSIDPDTGEANGRDIELQGMPGGHAGSDLASCANPSTLYLVKNLVGREKAGDQFRISVLGKGGVLLAQDETQGTGTGHLASAGVFIVKKGREYVMKEEPLNGARMSDYDTTFHCVDQYTGNPVEATRKPGANPTYGLYVAPGDSRDFLCTFTNTPKPKVGDVTWRKVSSATGERLGGSTWRIIPADGSTPIEVADNTGQPGYSGRDADPAVGAFAVKGLPLGRYTLHEDTAPSGYVPGNDRPFELDAGSASTPVALGDIENTPITGAVTWRKTDAQGRPVGGSVWVLTPTDPAGSARTIEDCTSAPCGASGDQDPRPGHFTLASIAFGTYALTEKTPPTGYIATDKTTTVVVKDNGATVDAGAIANKRLPRVSWTKVGDTSGGARLGGSAWTWQPTDPAGAAMTVDDCVADSAAECAGADIDPAEGAFLLKDVALGTYTLTEKTAPHGYQLDSTAHRVSVEAADADTTMTLGPFVNVKLTGPVVWSKTDADNGAALGGSEWALTGPGVPPGTVIADCEEAVCPAGAFADRDPAPGRFEVADLQASDEKYSLTEAKAPAGYVLDAVPHDFRISDAGGYAFSEAFTNAKARVPGLPLTGGLSTDSLLLAGAASLLCAGGTAMAVRKRRARR
ncbi:SpaA isopeptide-forming pilin-related protein [Actinomyces sp. B33]|uniref:MSCRAMM family protein n=1 Tax=Actinomyces sp. B33 TaxID=2942131 RepID=UPI0023415210|nr:SpaA isopeptide-forming pilin-related protein [Actinomyces sp. B33]MDC4232158.1 SpaA isopeptide-forming pilin-related protein [Actinomyces sp. B33]